MQIESIVAEPEAGLRLDTYLAAVIEDASRSFVKKLVKDGAVTLNGQVSTRPSRIVNPDDRITAKLPPPPATALKPEAIAIDIVYEDADVLVVNKPAGLVVHPAPGHPSGTLINAVLHHCADFQRPGEDAARPGIVHRLDQYTSGVMVVAKTPIAFSDLSAQARRHTFDRSYVALVQGEFKESSGRISAALGRSIHDRTKITVTGVNSRDAVTRFEVLEPMRLASYIALKLETGRTHQIRVHLRFAGHPVLGDPIYGVTDFSRWPIQQPARDALEALNGQALHALSLGFEHPISHERMQFAAPPPPDFQRTHEALRAGQA